MNIISSSSDEKEKIVIQRKDINILIAEDVTHNIVLLIKMSETFGYKNIDTAVDGEEAIKKLQHCQENKNQYDVLLLDLKMPKIDGFGVAEFLQKNNYQKPRIAVISASVLEDDKRRCQELGIKYFILKPINMMHFKSVMQNLSIEYVDK